MAAKILVGWLIFLALSCPAPSFGGDVEACEEGECRANGDDVGMLQVAQQARSVPLFQPGVFGSSGATGITAPLDPSFVAIGSATLPAKTPLCRAVGARAWLTQKALDYLAENLLPLLLSEFNDAKFPQISNSSYGFKFEINDLTVRNIRMLPTDLQLSFVQGIGLRLEVKSITGDVSFSYSAGGDSWWNSIVSTSGSADVSLGKGSSLSGVIGASISAKGHPELVVQDLKINLDAHLSVHGTMLAGLIEALQSVIVPMVTGVMQRMLSNLPTDTINPILKTMSFRLPVPLGDSEKLGLEADFSICSIEAGSDYLAIDVVGEALSTTNPMLVYPMDPLPIPSMPPQGWKDEMVSLTMTKWTVNSGLWLAHQLGALSFAVTTKDLPTPMDIRLDTDLLGKLAPGMDKYTDVKNVSVLISPFDTPRVLLSEAQGITIDAPLVLSFEVIEGEGARTPAFAVKVPFLASGDVSVLTAANGTERIAIDLDVLKFTPVEVIKTAVGEVQLRLLNFLVDVVVGKVVLPKARSALAPGIPVVGAKGIMLQGLWLEVNDFLMGRSNIDWNLQQTVIEVFGSSASFVDSVLSHMKSTGLLQRLAATKAERRNAVARRAAARRAGHARLGHVSP